ncbi:hypothetical protein DOTSEDRAFT_26595 [Dothistroma septosporum NZE10]|uniref:Uncharacterized protein n=1 Tax=Dothistroma septosporum (strain NZE10 / CBS 128990) TaxID=675120 RepID=N1PJB6_DOTSN|nr:hypothetical protein DOTSEDRAFT_26595 [Dothistroma septosporum NZE10]
MPVVDDENEAPSMTPHAKLAADIAAADEQQRQTFASTLRSLASHTVFERGKRGHIFSTTRNQIISLSIAITASTYRNLPEGWKDQQEVLKSGLDLASKTRLPVDNRVYQRQLKDIERVSWSQYSQEQSEENVQGYVEKELVRLADEKRRRSAKWKAKGRSGLLEKIVEGQEDA